LAARRLSAQHPTATIIYPDGGWPGFVSSRILGVAADYECPVDPQAQEAAVPR
jgi:hypothetical protein